MPAAVLDLDGTFILEQHVDFLRTFQVNDDDGAPYDLTGAQLFAQIRRPLQRGTPVAEFSITIFDPPTAGAGFLALDVPITLNTREPYKWDLLMRQEGVDTRLAMGDVVVSPAVSTIEEVENAIVDEQGNCISDEQGNVLTYL